MAENYKLDWFDGNLKPAFTVSGEALDSVDTSLVLSGDLVWNWGEGLNEDYLKLLDHFASSNSPPLTPTVGQLWFNGTYRDLSVWADSLEYL